MLDREPGIGAPDVWTWDAHADAPADAGAARRSVPPDPGLRWAVHAFESAQRERVAVGEQIRAAVQGRLGEPAPRAADGLTTEPPPPVPLDAIARGEAASPVPVLDTVYRRLVEEEAAMRATMDALVRRHSAWPWVEQVRGVGATLAARLLARLDVGRAATPSAFWAYCGLHTEPAQRFVCDTCGAELVLAAAGDGREARLPTHRTPDALSCRGRLRPHPDLVGRRAARGALGPGLGFSRGARTVCHLVGVGLLRQGTHYKRAYRDERARLGLARPGWPPGRCHLAALRRVEKLFLAHLWLAWRAAVGLPVGAPHAAAGTAGYDPWSMVGR